MNVDTVLAAIGAALKARAGLRFYDYEADSITPPAAVIPAPVEIDYDQAKAGGLHMALVEVFVLVPTTDARKARQMLAGYQSTTGPSSVKAALEHDVSLGGVVQTLSVLSCSVRAVPVGDHEYRAAIFTVELYTL